MVFITDEDNQLGRLMMLGKPTLTKQFGPISVLSWGGGGCDCFRRAKCIGNVMLVVEASASSSQGRSRFYFISQQVR